jgi:transcriptional regulator with XRE-family HTH domain
MISIRCATTILIYAQCVDFSSAFSLSLRHAGLSQNKAGPRLGCSGPFVNQLVRGKAKPPLDRLTHWADVLSLSGAERERFIILGHLAHATPLVRALVAEQERRLAAAGVRETIHLDALTNEKQHEQDDLDLATQSLRAALEVEDGKTSEPNTPGAPGHSDRAKKTRKRAVPHHALP